LVTDELASYRVFLGDDVVVVDAGVADLDAGFGTDDVSVPAVDGGAHDDVDGGSDGGHGGAHAPSCGCASSTAHEPVIFAALATCLRRRARSTRLRPCPTT